MDELVSVIIPAYQQERWIGRCLRSVLASSYRNLEIIVVNDESTDKTEEVAQKYIRKTKAGGGPELKLINIPHGGPARARNAGLREARGQFIGFLDADDMMGAQMIGRLVKSLLRGNDLAACGQQISDENGAPNRFQYPLRAKRRRCPGPALELVMWEQILMSVAPILFRREIILDEDGNLLVEFPEEIHEFEDFVFVCRYISRCKGFLEVIPFYGTMYCKRAGSLTAKARTVEELRYAMQLILDIGERAGGGRLTAHKLQYAFRFMAFWYKEALRCGRKDFSPGCESWKVCMEELERYAKVFMSAGNVPRYQKLAMHIVRKHPGAGRILIKAAGKLWFVRMAFGMRAKQGDGAGRK